ncbi:MAG: GntR family transcriptional regulator [Solirubrobacterales bacterium]
MPDNRSSAPAALALGSSSDSPRTVTQSVALRLRNEILSGQLAPGTRLHQTAVAERFNVSITPVREAFSLLGRWGLVTNEAHRGTAVFEPHPDDLRHSYEIRIVLEELATRKGVPNLSDDDIVRLRTALDESAGLPVGDEREIQLNSTFHDTIYHAAGNPKLNEMIDDLRLRTLVYVRLFSTELPAREEGMRQHEAIYDACLHRSADQAALKLRVHLEHTFEVVMKTLRDREHAGGAPSEAA